MKQKLREEDFYGMSDLELIGILGSIFYNGKERYNGDVENIAEQTHVDLSSVFPDKIKKIMCKYISSYVSDVCQIQKKGDVRIVKGVYIKENGENWEHHWNYDQKSGLFIDAMANTTYFSLGNDEFFKQKYKSSENDRKYLSKDLFDYGDLLMLESVKPFVSNE